MNDIILGKIKEEIYFNLDSIQDGAKPYLVIDNQIKRISVINLWVSSHYDAMDTPSTHSVASEVYNTILEHTTDYDVFLSIHDTKGQVTQYNCKVDFPNQLADALKFKNE